jgi:hypothetical protein
MHASTLNMLRPGRILLVTDLSARSHLALDRAAGLPPSGKSHGWW